MCGCRCKDIVSEYEELYGLAVPQTGLAQHLMTTEVKLQNAITDANNKLHKVCYKF